jgi:hypothetical protein
MPRGGSRSGAGKRPQINFNPEEFCSILSMFSSNTNGNTSTIEMPTTTPQASPIPSPSSSPISSPISSQMVSSPSAYSANPKSKKRARQQGPPSPINMSRLDLADEDMNGENTDKNVTGTMRILGTILKKINNIEENINISKNDKMDAYFNNKNKSSDYVPGMTHDWLAINESNGHLFCSVCSACYNNKSLSSNHRRSKWFLQNGGFKYIKEYEIYRHGMRDTHKICEQELKIMQLNQIDKGIQNMRIMNKSATINQFKAVIHSIQRVHSVRDIQHLYAVLDTLGVNMGNKQHDRLKIRHMIIFLHTLGSKQLQNLLKKKVGGYPRHVSPSVDKESEYMRKYQICNARFQLDGVPIQMNLDLARITDDYTEEGNAAGGGFALFNIMFESLEWFGVNCFQIDDGIEEQKDDGIDEFGYFGTTNETSISSPKAVHADDDHSSSDDDSCDDSSDDSSDVPLAQLREWYLRKKEKEREKEKQNAAKKMNNNINNNNNNSNNTNIDIVNNRNAKSDGETSIPPPPAVGKPDESGRVKIWELKRKKRDQPSLLNEPILWCGVSPYLSNIATDSEACYLGKGKDGNSMNYMLWSNDGLNDPRFKEDHIHDFGHALDLLIEGAHKAVNGNYIFETIHKVVKAVYSEFSVSPKRYNILMKVIDELDVTWYQLHYIFEVRFINSEYVALKNLLSDLPIVVKYFCDTRNTLMQYNDEKSIARRQVLSGLIQQISQVKFITYLSMLVDIHEQSKIFSKAVQSNTNLVIDYIKYYDHLKAGYITLKNTFGTRMAKYFKQLNDSNCISMKTKKGDELKINVLGLGPIKDLKSYMMGIQKSYITSILDNFDDRIKMIPVAKPLKKLFDLKYLPYDDGEALEEWGNDEIEYVVKNKLPYLDLQKVKAQYLILKYDLRNNYDDYKMMSRKKDGTSVSLFDRSHVFKKLLNEEKTGNGLFIPELLCVLDYMLSYRIHSCDVERSGGLITRTLTKFRTLMHDDLLRALVFLCESLPGIDDIDFDHLYNEWEHYLNTSGKRKDFGKAVTATYDEIFGSSTFERLRNEKRKQGLKPLFNKKFKDYL